MLDKNKLILLFYIGTKNRKDHDYVQNIMDCINRAFDSSVKTLFIANPEGSTVTVEAVSCKGGKLSPADIQRFEKCLDRLECKFNNFINTTTSL